MKIALRMSARVALITCMLGWQCTGADEAREVLVFAGVLISGGETYVIIVNSESGHSSGWIRTGHAFEEYHIERYDPKTECLYLVKNGSSKIIHIVRDAKIIPSGTVVELGNNQFKVFADSSVTAGGVTRYHGFVTAIGVSERISADELTFDAKEGVMEFEGQVRMQNADRLLIVERVKLRANRQTGEIETFILMPRKGPNKSPEPTPTAVTPRATGENQK